MLLQGAIFCHHRRLHHVYIRFQNVYAENDIGLFCYHYIVNGVCSFFKRRTCFNETLVGYKILLQGAMHYFRHWRMFTLKLLPKILMLKMISVLSGTILTTNSVWLCSLETCLDDILASHECFYKELHLLIGFNCCICPVPLPVVLLAGRYLPSPFDQVY